MGEHLPCKQGVMSSNLTISTRIYGFESAKITWVIPYLDNFTLIKIIKETYVDLIVTDIRFYRMKDFERNDSFDVNKPIQATNQTEKFESSNLFNKFLRTRKTSVTLYRRTAKTDFTGQASKSAGWMPWH